ncbi:hypothetical protein WJX73_002984 [Symbiochloris irregularis]|uniref:Membrane insertase YidC/Oxa/ALB C-terminal domain-containing protein n=1 Tax=Symbiochloris irregularis TaxID=706552 RepID=A0AAW1P2Z6_9CHLO
MLHVHRSARARLGSTASQLSELLETPILSAARDPCTRAEGSLEFSRGQADGGLDLQDGAGQLADAGQDFGPVLSHVTDAIDTLHSFTHLPWWATIVLTAVGLRVALLPLARQQLQTFAALQPLVRQAASGQGATGSVADFFSRFGKLRREHSAAHPAWLFISPAVQIPVLVASVMAVRRMALHHWQGFDTGGTLWFTDLTAPALIFDPLTAPLGAAGIALPAAFAVAMIANLDRAFPAKGPTPAVFSALKLGLEWSTVALLFIALQLPQGAVLYWLTSLSFSLCQGPVMAALGLAPKLPGSFKDPFATPWAHTAASKPGTPAQLSQQQAVLPPLEAQDSAEVSALFLKAAEARAAHDVPLAVLVWGGGG